MTFARRLSLCFCGAAPFFLSADFFRFWLGGADFWDLPAFVPFVTDLLVWDAEAGRTRQSLP